jgi:DNA-binding HxlR family transcriptional regulator
VTRSGTRALALLAVPLNGTILRCLSEKPKRLIDLRRECGSPAQTTLRAHLQELDDVGALARRRCSDFPGAMECELTGAGQELLLVAAALEHWLQGAPDGALRLGDRAAKAAVKALVDGWSTTMLRALAARPLSLTELDGVIGSLSYPTLQRRLTAMRLAGQVQVCSGQGNGTTPYGVTEWLRRGIAPLAAAARWERRHIPADSAPVTRIDTEAAFLLTLPLLRLAPELSGSCRLGIELRSGSERRLAGAMAYVEEGRIASCSVRLEGHPDAWVTGSATGWLHAVVDSDADGLELGGDQRLARSLLDGLHGTLFGAESKRTSAAQHLS